MRDRLLGDPTKAARVGGQEGAHDVDVVEQGDPLGEQQQLDEVDPRATLLPLADAGGGPAQPPQVLVSASMSWSPRSPGLELLPREGAPASLDFDDDEPLPVEHQEIQLGILGRQAATEATPASASQGSGYDSLAGDAQSVAY